MNDTNEENDFDKRFKDIFRFIKIMIIGITFVSLAVLTGMGIVAYELLVHFGVI
jgi:hypothetical protein